MPTRPSRTTAESASVRELAVGQLVAIRAMGSGDQLHAESIAVIRALVGPIEALDSEAGTLRVLGERARLPTPAGLGAYRVGNWVRLSGNPQADGVLAVTGIEAAPPTAERQAQIAGRVNAVTSRSNPGRAAHACNCDPASHHMGSCAVKKYSWPANGTATC